MSFGNADESQGPKHVCLLLCIIKMYYTSANSFNCTCLFPFIVCVLYAVDLCCLEFAHILMSAEMIHFTKLDFDLN